MIWSVLIYFKRGKGKTYKEWTEYLEASSKAELFMKITKAMDNGK